METEARQLRSWERDLRYRVRVLKRHVRGRRLDELNRVGESIKKTGLQAGAQAATVNRMLAILRRIARLTDMPWRVAMLPGERQRHVYLSEAEVRRLAAKARPIVRDFIWFAALTGMRRGEILSLRSDSVVDGAARLSTSKSGRARAVPLPPAALRIAKRRLPWALTTSNLNKLFREAREAAGMKHVRLHDLRHTYASWLVQAGESLATVRDLLGHSSLQVTSRYAHLDLEHLRRAVARLPDIGTKSMKTARRR